MKQLTREWIVKAEGDFALVKREARVRASPNYDAVCFHAQQCAEKYLKARLCEARLEFPKTHDLNALLDIIIPLESRWELYRPDLVFLTDFAVSFPCLKLGYEASKIGGTMPAVLNAANEVAVEAFLGARIRFIGIPKIIEKTMRSHSLVYKPVLADIFAADAWARETAEELT